MALKAISLGKLTKGMSADRKAADSPQLSHQKYVEEPAKESEKELPGGSRKTKRRWYLGR
jgi:hypothetical protein